MLLNEFCLPEPIPKRLECVLCPPISLLDDVGGILKHLEGSRDRLLSVDARVTDSGEVDIRVTDQVETR